MNGGDVPAPLPAPWELTDPATFGGTRLGGFPPVTGPEAEVRLAAIDRNGGGALLILWKSDRLKADADTKDALAVAAPATLSAAWGAPYRILWADAGEIAGRRVIQIQGSFATEDGERFALMAWVPGHGGHHQVIGLMPSARAEDLRDLVEGVVATLPGATPSGISGESVVRVVVATALLLAVAFAGFVTFRRRR